jgi:hypothetical protein
MSGGWDLDSVWVVVEVFESDHHQPRWRVGDRGVSCGTFPGHPLRFRPGRWNQIAQPACILPHYTDFFAIHLTWSDDRRGRVFHVL